MEPTHFEYWSGVVVLLAYFAVMQRYKLLPPVSSWQEFVTMLNSKGGNILVLLGLSLYFFNHAQHMYYAVLDKIHDQSIATDNGIALNGLAFAAGAFGLASGALIKVMSGDEPLAPLQSETKTTTTSTVTPPIPPEKAQP